MNEAMIRYIMRCKLMLLTENVPPQFKWIAMDSDGQVVVYLTRPKEGDPHDSEATSLIWYTGDAFDGVHTNPSKQYREVGIIREASIDWKKTAMTIQDILDYD